MPCDYARLPHKGIQSLKPYIPGKSAEKLAEEQGLDDIIKLASNENPLGCSHLVTNALAALSSHQISTYPIASQHPICAKLATKLGIDVNMLTLTSGSEALISLLQTCFALHSNKHILIPTYSFIAYSIHANALGIPFLSTPVLPNWQADIDALISCCNDKTALIFLANPNNPTGSLIKHGEIQRLLEHIPQTTILVLDEAYYEYVSDTDKLDTLSLLNAHPNLVVARTFSKVYGLAGLRLGYAISNPQINSILQRVMSPFAVNEVALLAGNAALDDDEFIQQSINNNVQGLKQIQHGLTKLGISYLPTAGNFITFDCKTDATPLYQKLLQCGIILRPLHPYGLNNYLRVTIGTEEQNTRFLNKLKELHHEK
jgi:histidinol-phosphate aminotransferase